MTSRNLRVASLRFRFAPVDSPRPPPPPRPPTVLPNPRRPGWSGPGWLQVRPGWPDWVSCGTHVCESPLVAMSASQFATQIKQTKKYIYCASEYTFGRMGWGSLAGAASAPIYPHHGLRWANALLRPTPFLCQCRPNAQKRPLDGRGLVGCFVWPGMRSQRRSDGVIPVVRG